MTLLTTTVFPWGAVLGVGRVGSLWWVSFDGCGPSCGLLTGGGSWGSALWGTVLLAAGLIPVWGRGVPPPFFHSQLLSAAAGVLLGAGYPLVDGLRLCPSARRG